MHRTAQGCITGSQDPRHGFQWRLVYAHDTRFQCLCVSCSVAEAVQRRLSSHPSKHRWACEAQLAVRPNNTAQTITTPNTNTSTNTIPAQTLRESVEGLDLVHSLLSGPCNASRISPRSQSIPDHIFCETDPWLLYQTNPCTLTQS